MEQKKELSWDERHPMGNLRYYTFVDGFDGVNSLGETATKCAFRLLKYQLEDKLGFELTDEQFTAIFFRVINLGPARPLGMYSFQYGFVEPMRKLLAEQHLSCNINDIFSFFNVRNSDRRHYRKLFLHIPHSSISFPVDSPHTFDDLDCEERLLVDYYTDELFLPNQTSENIDSLVFQFCRLYCDVERLVNDPLEKEGLGIRYIREVPAERKHYFTLRSFSTNIEAFNYYVDFHAKVSKKLFELGEETLLVDCHSFSNIPNLLCANPPDIDICIGYNDDETHPIEVAIGNIVQYFKSHGYKVGINKPFSNSKTFNVPMKYHSVMIEVNKRLYMNEQTLEKSDSFYKLKHDIQSLYNVLLKK